jgi:ADP-ribosylglycohydrolase
VFLANPMMSTEQRGTLRLLLSGLAAGDSLGSTSEFVAQSQVPALYAKLRHEGWPFTQVGGGAFGWELGAPTDDTDQALCLVRSFAELGRFDAADVGRRLVAWLDGGPRDVGGTTARTLGHLRSGTPWHEAGRREYDRSPTNAANGSLMRNGVLPGLLFGSGLRELFRATVHHSITTHYHPLPVVCCAAQSWVVADLLAKSRRGPTSDPDGWLDAFRGDWTNYLAGEDDPHVAAWAGRVGPGMSGAVEALRVAEWDHRAFDPFATDFGGRAGYCLLTLQIGVWALQWSVSDEPFPVPAGFPADVFGRRGGWAVAWLALLGHDSDTYGAVAGPMLAAARGAVPAELTEGLAALAAFDAMAGTDAMPD